MARLISGLVASDGLKTLKGRLSDRTLGMALPATQRARRVRVLGFSMGSEKLGDVLGGRGLKGEYVYSYRLESRLLKEVRGQEEEEEGKGKNKKRVRKGYQERKK